MDEAYELILHRARAMLAQLSGFATLQPRAEDYAAVFVGAAAERAKTGYAGLWTSVPGWPVKPDQTEIHVTGAYSEDFASDGPRARPFPGGYKEIAADLVPGTLWLLWEHVVPGQRDGIMFDGLVQLGERWAWFPKPWRAVQAS